MSLYRLLCLRVSTPRRLLRHVARASYIELFSFSRGHSAKFLGSSKPHIPLQIPILYLMTNHHNLPVKPYAPSDDLLYPKQS